MTGDHANLALIDSVIRRRIVIDYHIPCVYMAWGFLNLLELMKYHYGI